MYYKNGYKLEALASKTTSAMAPSYHENVAGGSSSQASSQMMSGGNQSSSSQTLIGTYRAVTQKGNRNINKSVLNSMGAEDEGSFKN